VFLSNISGWKYFKRIAGKNAKRKTQNAKLRQRRKLSVLPKRRKWALPPASISAAAVKVSCAFPTPTPWKISKKDWTGWKGI